MGVSLGRNDPSHPCCGKLPYLSELEAAMEMRRTLFFMRNLHPDHKRPREVYCCEYNRWHITSWSSYSDEEAWELGAKCAPEGDTTVDQVDRLVMARDKYRCVMCEWPRDIQLFMRGRPLARTKHQKHAERLHDWRVLPSNLLTMCPMCLAWLDRNKGFSFETGWRLHVDQDPATWPVYRHRHWNYLNDDGTVDAVLGTV